MAAIDLIKRGGNQAVEINEPKGLDIHLTSHGSDWYWTLFSVFSLLALLYAAAGLLYRKRNERFLFYNGVASLFFLSIGYYTMASDLGWTGIQAEFNHAKVSNPSEVPGVREIFYTRYVAWFLSFPLLLVNFGIFSYIEWPTLIFTVLSQLVFIVALLIGSLISSTYKWGYFVFGVVAYLLVVYEVLFDFRKYFPTTFTSADKSFSLIFGGAYSLLLLLYPVCWGLSEGGNVIQPDSEAIFYGVLDLLLFGCLQGYFLFYTRETDFTQNGINIGNHAVFHSDKFQTTDPRYSTYSGATAAPITTPPEAAVPAPAATPEAQV